MAEQRQKEKEHDQDMTHMRTHIDLLTKCLLGRWVEKDKALEASNKYDKPEFDFEEEAMFPKK